LKRFRALDIDFEAIGLLQNCADDFAYFCTPVNAEFVGRLGVDCIHFVLLPGDERIFCVDPAMGEPGTYVLPVADNFLEFLSFVLFCKDANPLSQIWWMTEEQFQSLAAGDAKERQQPELAGFFEKKDAVLKLIEEEFHLAPAAPFSKVKAMQANFDPSPLRFSDEYYDVLGLDRPE